MNDSHRILLLAPEYNRQGTGEAWSTYQWASRLSRKLSLTVLTYHPPHWDPEESPLPGAEVVNFEEIGAFVNFKRFNAGVKPSFIKFYLLARRWLRNELAKGRRFDLAHQVAPLALRYPTPMIGFGIPYLIGPLGGSLNTPQAFRSECGSSAWYTRLRAVDEFRFRYDPWMRRTLTEADAIIGVAPYVRDLVSDLPIKRFAVMSETGVVDLPPPPPPSNRRPTDELKLLFVGRIVRTKGVRDAVRAVARVSPDTRVSLDIVGEGEDRAACEGEADRLEVSDRVHFHGRLSREEVNRFYADADVFLFPSFREASGNVVFEALSYGMPVVGCDRGGPGYVIDDTCGLRVPADSPEQFARDLAAAIERLASDPELLHRLRQGARSRIEEVALWDKKVDRMCDFYDEIIHAGSCRRAA